MIFIDPPYWPAHDTVFSHLISDTSLAELHAFAAAAGISDRAFDLDHYDVPEHRYAALVAAGAVPVSGKELARTLLGSGLRVKAKYRVKSVRSVLERRWAALLPGHPELGTALLDRWEEPHRHYHGTLHLLSMLEALDVVAPGAPPRTTVLAAWFHDAVYRGVAGQDERDSAALVRPTLGTLLPEAELAEVERLVLLTAAHAPEPGDEPGALVCDADLAVLGGAEPEYARYAAAVRRDFAHVPEPAYRTGRAAVLRALLHREPLFHTPTGQARWAATAAENLRTELTALTVAALPAALTALPVCEFAFPGPLRDQLVAAVLTGAKTATTGLLRDYEVCGEALPEVGRRELVLDSDGVPVAVIGYTSVRLVALGAVDLAHALDEGEGFTSVAQWRAGHEEFWHSADMRAALGDPAFTVSEDTVLVLERFAVVELLPAAAD